MSPEKGIKGVKKLTHLGAICLILFESKKLRQKNGKLVRLLLYNNLQNFILMKNFVSRLFMLLMLLAAVSISCKGPQGPEGPQGPAGPQGPQGPAGNANVISSAWITPSWVSDSYYGNSGYKYDWSVADLTQSVYDSGVILVYWKNWEGKVWILPQTLASGNEVFDYVVRVGQITLWYYKTDGSSASSPHSSNKFRYVLIPQGTSSRPAGDINALRQDLARQGVDIDNYYQVCDYFGLQP